MLHDDVRMRVTRCTALARIQVARKTRSARIPINFRFYASACDRTRGDFGTRSLQKKKNHTVSKHTHVTVFRLDVRLTSIIIVIFFSPSRRTPTVIVHIRNVNVLQIVSSVLQRYTRIGRTLHTRLL